MYGAAMSSWLILHNSLTNRQISNEPPTCRKAIVRGRFFYFSPYVGPLAVKPLDLMFVPPAEFQMVQYFLPQAI